MNKNISLLFLLMSMFCLSSCSKDENVNLVLQDKYENEVKESAFIAEDFMVSLNARALQAEERGEWKVLQGNIVDTYVYFEDKTDPFTKFKGLPGEEYTLEWRRWDKNKNESVVQTKVKIKDLMVQIEENTPSEFETIRFLSVKSNYKGTWSFDAAYGYIDSDYHNGLAEPPEKKPTISLHGYENTTYTVTYTVNYAGKDYPFKKVIKTGRYTQDEGLSELRLSRDDRSVVEDIHGNILELNLQGSGIAWILGSPDRYPALTAFKKLRKLILDGSSLYGIPQILADHYLDLEELTINGIINGFIPENFGNLSKLKVLDFSPVGISPDLVVKLPKSMTKLKVLESLSLTYVGWVDFNGTLGSLTSLKDLDAYTVGIPNDIGNLKALQHLDLYVRSPDFPQSFSECQSLTFARFTFDDLGGGNVVIPSKIGNLKKLETFYLTTKKLKGLPDSFSELSALKILQLNTSGLQSLPENFGNLSNLENLMIYGAFKKLPDGFGHLQKLSILDIGPSLESLPESFGDLSSLSYFRGENNKFKTLPKSIGKLKKLKEIALPLSQIEVLPASFSELDALEQLNLSTTALKTFPKEILSLKSIKNVLLNNTYAGDFPDEISRMKSGVTFHLWGILNLTENRLTHIARITKGMTFYSNFGYFTSSVQ